MSKLLFDEQPITLDRVLMKAIGINEAIVIQQLHYWIFTNQQKNRNCFNGRYWTYNALSDWHKNDFSFMSERTLRRTFETLEKKGLLLVGNYNKDGRDRTKWYTIDYEKMEELCAQNGANACGQNGQMQVSKLAQPLPENYYTEISNSTLSTSVCTGERERDETAPAQPAAPTVGESSEYTPEFKEFWQHYPRKIEKKRAFRCWKTLVKAKVDPQILITAAKNYAIAKAGEEEQYIKHAATFLGPDEPYLDYLSDNPMQEPKRRSKSAEDILAEGIKEWRRDKLGDPGECNTIDIDGHWEPAGHENR